MQAAENMFNAPIPAPNLKRKSTGDRVEQSHKRFAAINPMDVVPPAVPSPPLNAGPPPSHLLHLPPIQPRPTSANGFQAGTATPGPPAATVQKKRGRPSRADRHNQLRPRLPQHLTPLAPQPWPPAPAAAQTRPVPIAPAPGPIGTGEYSPGTPTTTYSASSAASGSQSNKKRGRPSALDKAEPASPLDGDRV